MKFYRLHVTVSAGTSAGYEFFTNKAGVKKAVSEWKAWKSANETGTTEIDVIEIEPTKVGIVRALNAYAAHPDNG